jgi:cell division protein FtsB
MEAKAVCDWCGKNIYDQDDVACKKCYEYLENKVFDLEAENSDLKAEKKKLEERIKELED